MPCILVPSDRWLDTLSHLVFITYLPLHFIPFLLSLSLLPVGFPLFLPRILSLFKASCGDSV